MSHAPEGCSQIFAECHDPHCTRDCGARRPIQFIQIVDAPVVRISTPVLVAAIIIIAILGGYAGGNAVERQDSAYQHEKV